MQTPTSRTHQSPALGTTSWRHGRRLRCLAAVVAAAGGGRRHHLEPTTRSAPPGSVAALSASSMEVQNASSGQTTVSWTPTTHVLQER